MALDTADQHGDQSGMVGHLIEFEVLTVLRALIVLENWLALQDGSWSSVDEVHITVEEHGPPVARVSMVLWSDVQHTRALLRSVSALRRAVARSWASGVEFFDPDTVVFTVTSLSRDTTVA